LIGTLEIGGVGMPDAAEIVLLVFELDDWAVTALAARMP